MKGVVMRIKHSFWALSVIVLAFAVSCTKGNTKPSYKYRAASGDGVAIKVGLSLIHI